MADAFEISLYESNRDNTPKAHTITWAGLVEVLSESQETPCDPCSDPKNCPAKYCEAWSPVRMHATCQVGARCRDSRHAVDEHHSANRAGENVREVTVAVFDLDHLDDAGVLDLATRVEGLSYVVHTTHSHRPPHDQALRLVVELSRPVPAADWRRFLANAVAHLGIKADPTCKDLSRLYFFPTYSRGQDHFAVESKGRPLDVDAVLSLSPAALPAQALAVPLPVDEVPATDAAPIDLAALVADVRELRRSYKAKGDTDRYEICDRILTGRALSPSGARDNTLNQAASMLATKLPPNTPASAALEILRRSIGAMPCEPEGLDHWLDRATYSYERAMQRRIENDRKRDEINAGLAARMRTFARPGTALAPRESATQPSAEEGDDGEESAAPAADEEWQKELLFKPVKDATEEPKLVQCEHNAALLLTHLPEWKGVIRFNEVSKSIEVTGGPLPETDRHLSVLSRAVGDHLQSIYGLALGEASVRSTLLLVARRNAYDPVRDYLTSLVWDGKSRCDDFLLDYCHAQPTDSIGENIEDHIRSISGKWLISCVARALDPGCKVDTVLVLEGFNGFRKSSVFEVLGGAWYAPSQQNLADKDTKMLAACSWIIELAELDAVRKSDREATNGFLSTRRDKFRPPYGAAIEEFPRRGVFVGTTEDEDWLSSWKGIRRWWPVKITKRIDLERVAEDRDQLWAEAVVRYRAGEQWYLDGDASLRAQAIAHDRVKMTGTLDLVAAWWHSLTPDKRGVQLRTLDVARDALHLTNDKITRNIEMDVGEALREMGFLRVRRMVHGVRIYMYESTEALRNAPVTKIGTSGAAFAVATSRAT